MFLYDSDRHCGVLSVDSFDADIRLESIIFDEAKILVLIHVLNINKVYGHDVSWSSSRVNPLGPYFFS